LHLNVAARSHHTAHLIQHVHHQHHLKIEPLQSSFTQRQQFSEFTPTTFNSHKLRSLLYRLTCACVARKQVCSGEAAAGHGGYAARRAAAAAAAAAAF
jgi:hypothetical protein